ncbi:hypothetical protein GGR53DRAFT_530338 [Hypoxylon sp. FL1150]|nr:hypothetical protein GGR53DRAFT_530338 [Hypoxylon sp. FL1150]
MSNPYFDRNYNPYSLNVMVGTGVAFIIVPILSVALRFYARSQLVNGQAAHTEQLYVYAKTKYAYQLIGTVGLAVIKLSVLLFYRRIFSVRAFRTVNNILIGLTVAWGVAFTFAVAFQCVPVSTFWDKLEKDYGDSCVKVQPFYLALAISDLLLDAAIFIVPIPHVQRLQMHWKQKIAVTGIFLLGSIVVAIGITRAVIFGWVLSFTQAEPFVYLSDITWYSAGTLFWHLVENVVGLLGCCVPTYAPLFKGLLQKRKTANASDASGLSAKKQTLPSAYRRNLDDEIPLAPGIGSGQAPASAAINYPIDPLPNWDPRVDRCFT